MKKIIKRIKQHICKHIWECKYIYNYTADWECKKCNKRKKGYAPIGLTNEDLKNIYK